MSKKTIIDSNKRNSIISLRDNLSHILYPLVKSGRTIIIVCIGTDRSTGDSLGPLIGEKLKFLVRDQVHIYGNLKTPVHAKNLEEIVNKINLKYKNPYIIAIDACLGSLQNVGKIILEAKPLHPGSAMNKSLPSIGDLSITGIVNISGVMEFMVLQNTRLFIVMQLADIISRGIYHAIIKTVGGKKSSNHSHKIMENM
ncbi:spore protease YyaC [Clostridium tyrobutyricum]|jgi:putative sporulation protein YyaC|uniref:spore protease YyaC n=1 Tax=Clostridium tyrobutyricum TaxID=1519 RepID=UPI00057DFEAC|nr:spore protease YyaC [Clostridium tyrobutyricum]